MTTTRTSTEGTIRCGKDIREARLHTVGNVKTAEVRSKDGKTWRSARPSLFVPNPKA